MTDKTAMREAIWKRDWSEIFILSAMLIVASAMAATRLCPAMRRTEPSYTVDFEYVRIYD
jgi:hypothetical protein